jgi:hypothetical protein
MRIAGAVAAAALLLLWPALLNGYPLAGTYLSQAINHYLGWDRPIFYSFFLLPLHMELTTWPAIAVQALLVAYMLHLLRYTLRPEWPDWSVVPLAGTLAMASSLPFVTAELMPDKVLPSDFLRLCATLSGARVSPGNRRGGDWTLFWATQQTRWRRWPPPANSTS